MLQDYEKQRWCEEVEKSDSQIIYISGRLIPEKERSAKAGMLNFCLGKIYPDQATARAVGFTELICVFKSDQVNRGVKAPRPLQTSPKWFLQSSPVCSGLVTVSCLDLSFLLAV